MRLIRSILAQTFRDFELVISDNASTDSTEEICRSYLARDSRIHYHRNETNIGGANNENLTFKMSIGQYFRLAAHDDICGPDLIKNLVQALDNNPDAVLALSSIMRINEFGERLDVVKRTNATEGSAAKRFSSLTNRVHDCEATYGLIRSDILRQTDLELNYPDSDRTFLCQLSLYGKFVFVDEVLFFKRIHPQMSTQVYTDWRARMAWFGQTSEKEITLPQWMQFFHFMSIISRAPISAGEKIKCYAHMLTVWMIQSSRWRSLGKDILLAAIKFSQVYLLPGTLKHQEATAHE